MQAKPVVMVLNGPNLNMLGQRDPDLYGTQTLAEIEGEIGACAAALGLVADCRQSNHEGELIDWLHAACAEASGLILNAGGYSHTSVAIRDAAALFPGPVVEVHLSNIHARAAFRRVSYISEVADGMICGLGAQGYSLAMHAVAARLENTRS